MKWYNRRMKKINEKYGVELRQFLRKLRSLKEEGKDLKGLRPMVMRLWLTSYEKNKRLPSEAREFFAESVKEYLLTRDRRNKKQREQRETKNVKEAENWNESDYENLHFEIEETLKKRKIEDPEGEPSLDLALREFILKLQSEKGRTVTFETISQTYYRQLNFYKFNISESSWGEKKTPDPVIMDKARKDND